MRFSRCLRSVVRVVAVGLAVTTVATSLAYAKPRPKPGQSFRLFSAALVIMQANRVQCRLGSDGGLCATGSSTVGGGIWPKGTADQYIFAGGIQVGGVVDPSQPRTVNGFAGDTAGAFFYNTSGTSNGTALRPVFASVDPADAAAWPTEARVPCSDPATTTIPGGLPPETIARCSANGVGGDPTGDLYDPALQGAITASQGDHWFVSWEGDPGNLASRTHPLGILVETRALAWNFPSGNEDIIYFVFTFYNVTSANPDNYNAIRQSIRPFIQQKGRDFQALNTAKFGINLPADGYTIKDIFVDVVNDMDVANANANYASVNVPFALGYTYENDFSATAARALGWTFDPAIFGSAPFFPGVGFVGVKYLRSPINPVTGQQVGLSLFGTFSNSVGSLTDPNDDKQLYRYITGKLLPTDGACTLVNSAEAKICSVNLDSPTDMRFFQSSGPFDLAPGQFGSIVVAYIFAAPVADGNCPGAACDVKAADGGDASRLTILGDPARMAGGVNQIDRMTGYLSFNNGGPTDTKPDTVTQEEFVTVKGSLLDKAIVAQSVFDTRFLLPFSPDAPEFFLVPGNNSVTVLWRPSATETTPDPFFVVAGNPLKSDGSVNALYDPNFRALDVEGYRVYRGRTSNPSQLTMLAQFDYGPDPVTGKGIYNDFRGTVNPTSQCAPELAITTACPVTFDNPAPGIAFTTSTPVDLVGTVTQVKVGNRVALADGTAQILPGTLDTAFVDITRNSRIGNGVVTALANTGVPFAFTDNTARNSVRYFYAVTAFDINSVTSGPSSLESGRNSKAVTPVAAPSNLAIPQLSFGVFGDDATDLSQEAVQFAINEETGRFNGPPPPTTAVGATFQPLIPALLPAVNLVARIDSARVRGAGQAYPGDGIAAFDCQGRDNGVGLCMQYFVTFTKDGVATSSSTVVNQPILTPTFGDPVSVSAAAGQAAIDPEPAALQKFGIPAGSTTFNASLGLTVGQEGQWSAGENFNGRRSLGSVSPGGSRWFDGANETLDDPTYSIRVGHLAGVDSIYAPLSHIDQDPVTPGVQGLASSICMQAFLYSVAPFSRQADMQVTWGDNGTIASVRDLTHHLPIPFKETPQGSYGFVPDANGNGKIDWLDIVGVEDVSEAVNAITFCNADNIAPPVPFPAPGTGAKLTQTAVVSPTSTTAATTDPAAQVTTGQGFGLYLAGHFHIFQLTGGALPAAGTKWTLRAYAGTVRASKNAETTDPSGYSYAAIPSSPAIPGLEVRFSVPAPTTVLAATKGDLSGVHTVPDPYYVRSKFESSTDQKILKFVGLPEDAIVRIYSASGVLVRILEHHAGAYDPTSGSQGSEIQWDLRNRNNQVVASGVYFYHVEAGDARRVGRFTVVNFAQ